MDDNKLLSICNAEIHNSLGYQNSYVSTQRGDAMKYYLKMPFGNEVDGRSQVVTSDVADAVDWMMPSLVRVFASTDTAVRFEAHGPEDEPQAEQETDYVNHVFYKENDGFLVLYSWFKDALLQKNGIVKVYWEESEKTTTETYEDLNDFEFTQLMQDEELTPIEHSEEIELSPDENGNMLPQKMHDVKFKRTCKEGQCVVVPVPPEEFLISRAHNSVNPDGANFVGHKVKRSPSELKEMGYSDEVIESLNNDDEVNWSQEKVNRFMKDDPNNQSVDSFDPSLREIWVTECFMKVDYDEDGIAELRKVTISGNTILDNEEIDMMPFAVLTPNIMTHKFYGLSLADQVMDIQSIRSTLFRQILDNVYFANNGRFLALEGRVNLDDLLTSRPGGIVRATDPNAVIPIQVPQLGDSVFRLLETLDTYKADRTGQDRGTQGLDADVLKYDTATAANHIMTASQQQPELIARIFAETGIKQLFLKIHELLIKHQDKEKVVKLRNRWVEVNPAEWKERNNLTVTVGLGTGNREQTGNSLLAIYNLQKDVAMSGGGGTIVKPNNIYNTANKFVEAVGLKESALFFNDPSIMPPPPPPPPDPQMAAVQAQMQIENDKRQVEMQKMQLEHQYRMQQLQLDGEKAVLQAKLDAAKNQADMIAAEAKSKNAEDANVIKQLQASVEAQIRNLEVTMANKREEERLLMEKYKTDIEAHTQVLSKSMDHHTQMMSKSMDLMKSKQDAKAKKAAKPKGDMNGGR